MKETLRQNDGQVWCVRFRGCEEKEKFKNTGPSAFYKAHSQEASVAIVRFTKHFNKKKKTYENITNVFKLQNSRVFVFEQDFSRPQRPITLKTIPFDERTMALMASSTGFSSLILDKCTVFVRFPKAFIYLLPNL